ncbi:hypothetical protein ES703_00801 [subsurface metagenome]
MGRLCVFDPDDFLNVARKIIGSDYEKVEAVMRTAVSRAYYSSFLACKQFAISQGEINLKQYDRADHPRHGEVHRAVRDALMEVDRSDAASFLYDLSSRRVVADYKILETVNKNDAIEAIELSLKIKQQIQ